MMLGRLLASWGRRPRPHAVRIDGQALWVVGTVDARTVLVSRFPPGGLLVRRSARVAVSLPLPWLG